MALNERVRKVISLSAASMALLQSAGIVCSKPSQNCLSASDTTSTDELRAKTDRLMLQTPTDNQPLLYADHTSHASHESHSSHYSGTTDGGDYSTPAPTYPTYTPPPPTPPPPPVTVVTKTVYVTNTVTVPVATNNVTAQDDADEIKTLTLAAAKGSSDAQLALGLTYLNGVKGVKKNPEKAKTFFELAAAQGNSYAKLLLDQMNETETDTNSVAKP